MSPVDDDWQWLEAQEAPECLEWVEKQNASSKLHLDALPDTQKLTEKLQDLASNDARRPDFWIVGEAIFRLRKSKENREGILEVAKKRPDGTLEDWRAVIDIDELGRKEKKSFQFSNYELPSCVIGPSPWRLLLLLSVGGSDTVELREVDIDRGSLVYEGGFCTGEGRLSIAWLDAGHVLINHALDGGPVTKAGWPRSTYLWKRGTALGSAKLVATAEETDSLCMVSSFGAGEKRYGLLMRAIDYATLVYYLISRDGSAQEISLPRELSLTNPRPATSDHVIVSLQESSTVCGVEVPAGTVLAYSVAPNVREYQHLSIVYIPKDGEVNAHAKQQGVAASRSRVYLVLTKRGFEHFLVLECRQDSWFCVRREQIDIGSHRQVIASDSESDDVIIRQSGLLEPSSAWLKRADGTDEVLHKQATLFNSNNFIVEQRTTNSKDGTEIDYITLYPHLETWPIGGLRLLMTGYGAYGVSFSTDYVDPMVGGISLIPWIEAGGALVIPIIRGGGERGEDWHQAARQEKRQNSYDDFIAVTEKLIVDGFTSLGRIGVFGTSNGGLLAAVMGTQRPDLYSAIVSDVPLTDMLRYPYMAMGAAWIYEYGDPEDPEMASILHSYSPFHNVKPGQSYPAFLVSVSTRDDRVGAGHARKLVAKLQSVRSPNAFLFEDTEGGHGVSDSFKNIYLMSRRMAFLMNYVT